MKNFLLLIVFLYLTNLHTYERVQQYQTQQTTAYKIHLLPNINDSRYTSLEMLYDKSLLRAYSPIMWKTTTIFLKLLRRQSLSELYPLQDKFIESEGLKTDKSQFKNSWATAAFALYCCKNGINTPISYLNYNSEFPNDGGLKLINGFMSQPTTITFCTKNK
jgi:hypothetical protein